MSPPSMRRDKAKLPSPNCEFPIGNTSALTVTGQHRNIEDEFPIGVIPDREYYVRRDSRSEKAPLLTKAIEKSPQTIGSFVRERRHASNLTQQQLGELAGVGTRFVSDLERGKVTLRMDAVNRVLHVFGQMLGHVEEPRDENE